MPRLQLLARTWFDSGWCPFHFSNPKEAMQGCKTTPFKLNQVTFETKSHLKYLNDVKQIFKLSWFNSVYFKN